MTPLQEYTYRYVSCNNKIRMSATLDVRDSRLARYLQVSDDLHKRILNGEWGPGDAISSESSLAEEYRVALGTMRKAIQQLMTNGLLERQHGVGTFVRRADFNKSLFRFFRFVDDGGERIIPESRILNIQTIDAPAEPARKLDVKENTQVIWISRLRLIKNEPVLIEDIWLSLPKFRPLLQMEPSSFPALLYPLYEQECGQAVVSAQEELMVEKVNSDNAKALHLQPNEPVILIDRIATDISEKPLEWRRSRGAAERFHYQVNIL